MDRLSPIMEKEPVRQQAPVFQPSRNPQARPADFGLYRFENEHDACGVGMIARLDDRATHDIIEKGIGILKRLMHRGAAGGDPLTGDGAGLLFAIPDRFFRAALKKQKVSLPSPGRYAVAMIFGADGQEAAVEACFASEGLAALAWREGLPQISEDFYSLSSAEPMLK